MTSGSGEEERSFAAICPEQGETLRRVETNELASNVGPVINPWQLPCPPPMDLRINS